MAAKPSLPVRETPVRTLLQNPSTDDPTRPDATNEPELAVNNIQGNILAGFNKDHQAHLYLKIQPDHVEEFRAWLGRMVPFVATTSEVLHFNRLFKEVRHRRGVDSRTVMATWINIGLSFHGLKLLAGNHKTLTDSAKHLDAFKSAKPDQLEVEKFTDAAFRQGMASRSVDVLSDPPDASKGHAAGEGN